MKRIRVWNAYWEEHTLLAVVPPPPTSTTPFQGTSWNSLVEPWKTFSEARNGESQKPFKKKKENAEKTKSNKKKWNFCFGWSGLATGGKKTNILRCFWGAARELDQWRVWIFKLSKVRHLLSYCRGVCWQTHMKRNQLWIMWALLFSLLSLTHVANGSNILPSVLSAFNNKWIRGVFTLKNIILHTNFLYLSDIILFYFLFSFL